MKGRDHLELALNNLWRRKLRSLLTIAGVTIAIATFVAMLSFAAGNHRYFNEAFSQFGLLTSMNVYPGDESDAAAGDQAVLDADAVEALAAIPGVAMAFPFESFLVAATCGDTTVTARVRALPPAALETPLFTGIMDGAGFGRDQDDAALVTREFAELIGEESPESLTGRRLILEMRVARLDSGLAAVSGTDGGALMGLAAGVRTDSLVVPEYRDRLLRRKLADGIGDFMAGFMNRRAVVRDTLTIVAVGADLGPYRISTPPIMIPESTARRFESSGINLDGDPAGLMTALRKGRIFQPGGPAGARSYPQVTLELEPLADHAAVADSVTARGFEAFSFAEQFAMMQRFMLYYYAGLGVVGLIALVTAALGIVNTMVMSITERRREIGLLKSLGTTDGDIRGIFLVESLLIGAVGSALGIVGGWVATRLVSAIMQGIMSREEMLVFDPFSLPVWLVAVALVFGVLVSLTAGLFPAGRAAAVDPVVALRYE